MGRVLQIYGSEGQERMTHIMFSPLSMTLFFVIVHYVDGDVLAKMLVTRMDGWMDANSIHLILKFRLTG